MRMLLAGSVCGTTALSAVLCVAGQRLCWIGVAVMQRIKREIKVMPLSKRTAPAGEADRRDVSGLVVPLGMLFLRCALR